MADSTISKTDSKIKSNALIETQRREELSATVPITASKYNVKLYTPENADELTEEKMNELVSIYKDRYSQSPWNLSAEDLEDEIIKKLIKYSVHAKGGMVITIEEQGNVVGHRIAVGFTEVTDAVKADSDIADTVEKVLEGTNCDAEKISYTIDFGVALNHEGEGLAKKMLLKHIEAAQRQGFSTIVGWTIDGNAPMIGLGYKAGYKPIPKLENIHHGTDFDDELYDEGETPIYSYDYFEEEDGKTLTYTMLEINGVDLEDVRNRLFRSSKRN